MNYTPVKIGCLVFYAAALVSLFVAWPPLLENILQIGTLILVVTHALEVPVGFKWIKRYEGPLVLSILLTLLFGFAHWMPYKRAAGPG